MERRRILVVDDELSIATSTALLLEDLGFDVATCTNAQDILRTLEKERPDLLLQDIRMPGLNLEDLVFQLRQDPRWSNLPIVIFSAGMNLDEVAERVRPAATLDKPFKAHELMQAIQSALTG